MAQQQRASLISFNRGLLSRFGVARIDLKRTAMAATLMNNWTARVLGSMMLRAGLGFIGALGECVMLPFVFDSDTMALIELGDRTMRIWVDDELVTRVAVSSAIANGTFTTNLASWTSADEAGATSAFAAGGFMSLIGTGSNAAIRYQLVTVAAADQGVRHALRIVIERGPVTLRIGSTLAGDEYINETVLLTGTHSIAFTPTGDFYVQFSNLGISAALVDSVAVEGAGVMSIPTPWTTDDHDFVRAGEYSQSADVLFVACKTIQQRRIERRAQDSWSVVLYQSDTGPFRLENIGPITIAPSALSGDITLTASKALFRSTQVGGLFRITSTGQTGAATLSGNDQFTNSITVTGVGGQRAFSIILSGVVDSIVTLQQSLDNASWVDMPTTYTSDTSVSFNDELDNQLVYYRIGVKAGDYGSDTITASLVFSSGSTTGIARVTAYTSPLLVSASVLSPFGATTASTEWSEGAWSDYRGWPSAVALDDDRLWWFGKSMWWGSIVDAYDDFDDFFEGDAGPISRTIGSGPVDTIHWALPLDKLFVGTVSRLISARSTTFDEPLTPTNFHLDKKPTQGTKNIDAVEVDGAGVFVHGSGQALFELAYDIQSNNYVANELSLLVPDLNEAGIVQIAVQRRPDTRLHCIRTDGTVAMMVMDRAENVICWSTLDTNGTIERAVVLPGTSEDQVYYVVNRANGRYLEKWALESECRGATLNKQADSFLIYEGVATSTLTAAHLANQSVVVWGDGVDLGTFDANASGVIDLGSVTVENAVYGLGYTANFKSTKLGQAIGTPLNSVKRIDGLGLVLADTHAQGIQFGPDEDNLDDMPGTENEEDVDLDEVRTEYEGAFIEFPGDWDTDARLYLRATAPRPACVLAASHSMKVTS